jgi:hypothetical protein
VCNSVRLPRVREERGRACEERRTEGEAALTEYTRRGEGEGERPAGMQYVWVSLEEGRALEGGKAEGLEVGEGIPSKCK